jgi:hypothetical protein
MIPDRGGLSSRPASPVAPLRLAALAPSHVLSSPPRSNVQELTAALYASPKGSGAPFGAFMNNPG